uniref:Uncharacterized protein n=1 Tax=Arundo donax TaxID=35708 RepID=A0A0A9HU99_ARUDO
MFSFANVMDSHRSCRGSVPKKVEIY